MAKAKVKPVEDTEPRVADPSDDYGYVMSASASSRRYLDIEPNISVRDEYTRDDYYGFRPSEYTQNQSKKLMGKCAQAYDNVGLIKQVIDLMGDFASQGIRISHTSKPIERFYRRW